MATKKLVANEGVIDSEVEKYLASLPSESLKVIENFRKVIRSVAPKANEVINYGIPMFIWNGKNLAGYAVAKEHYSYYPASPPLIEKFADELKSFETSKGTIRFTADNQLSDELIKRIVKVRIEEIENGGKY